MTKTPLTLQGKSTWPRRAAAALSAVALLGLLAATPAFADNGDDQQHGGNAPEVPLALLVPAIGGLALGGRAILAKRASRRG